MSVDQHPGVEVMQDPLKNKGTAFSEEERSELGLRGLPPTEVETLEQQVLPQVPGLPEAANEHRPAH